MAFSLFDAILLRPLPYVDSDRLIRVFTFSRQAPQSLHGASLPDFEDWQQQVQALSPIAAWVSFPTHLTGRGPARMVRTTFATPQLFETLGVRPILGRTFRDDENVHGGDLRKVVLGVRTVQEAFGGSPDVIGRQIQMRDRPHEVIDTGIRTDGVLVASVAGDIVANSTREESIARHARGFRQMREALGMLPGVHAVTAATRIPFLNAPEERAVHELYSRWRDTPETAYRGALRTSNAMPEYFATLGVPILDGRDFADTDTLEDHPRWRFSASGRASSSFKASIPWRQQVRWGVDPYFWATVIGIVPNTTWHQADDGGRRVLLPPRAVSSGDDALPDLDEKRPCVAGDLRAAHAGIGQPDTSSSSASCPSIASPTRRFGSGACKRSCFSYLGR